MRTALLTAVLLALATQPAFATGGGHGGGGKPQFGTIHVVNSSDQEVEVAVNGGAFYSLMPNGGLQQFALVASNRIDVTVSARLPGIPESLASQTATVQASKATVATVSVTGSTVSISAGRPGQVARFLREAGVALASGGGLMPLLCLGILLGRRPLRRQPSQPEQM